jgi:DNA-binding response OmpR family regulator
MKILVVDDDLDLLGLIAYALRQAGYFVLEAANGLDAWQTLYAERPDLVVLDVNLPGIDGLEVLRRTRAAGLSTPVILLTVRDTEEDEVMGLDLGADDYLTKPFSPRMLLARVRAALRRAPEAGEPIDEIGRLRLLRDRPVAVIDGANTVELTRLEHRLLQLLMASAERVVSADRITAHVWGHRDDPDRQLLKQLVHRLRQKIEEHPTAPAFLLTEPGRGYRLDPYGGAPPSDEPLAE